MKKKLGLALAAALAIGLVLAGCGKKESSAVDTKDDGKMMTVTVYDDLANYQGTQGGWFGKLVKDKFNMKLNIIAPNVAGGGSTLFDTRSAAGNLGNLIITGSGSGRAKRLIKSGLIVDMTPYAKNMKYITKYKAATEELNKIADQKSGIWGVPSGVSTASPTEPSEGNDPTFGPYIRWDLYKQVGYPKLKTLSDLLPVLKEMQDKARQQTGDKKIYAMSLFKDWDGNMMNNAKQPTTFYGYDEMGFVLAKADGSDYQSITQSNGEYEKALQFFNKANQMGLVDPESSTQNYDTMYAKYQQGKVLFSFWPWLGQAAYNTDKNKEAGRGFEIAPVQDMKIFSYGATPNGGSTFIAVGSKAKNKARLVKFINWLYSPEGVYASSAQTNGSAGIKGLTWKLVNGKPTLTDFGNKVFFGGGANVPKNYGGGAYKDGVAALNYPTESVQDIDPNTGYAYNANMWPSTLAKNTTPLDKDWSAHMGGAKTTMDYLKKNNKILVAPGASYVQPDEESQVSTLRGQIKTQIVNSSWKMVYAKSDSEFNSLFKQMQTTVNGLDYAKVLKVDMQNAKDQQKARVAITKEYKNRE
ncbi:extracellular solute-binding protein [Schleiferilactobacillus harbinensis]|uniref:ABC transporter substrate-binding protein n=1 Tax=Schleiferilactobacillus harbinensis TaxID=304207 RepID=A0A5P8M1N2_9LACO|nr:extracellular solute-binding protein [Schleiferilactobacillus harbinensis]QFR22396.1 ABC transporter substrate-binding protein [Schleiferilactobacillus harbinensis]